MYNKIRFDSSIFSTPKRGEGGKSSYRGNCCPQIIEAFINQYNMKYLSDYAIGGGTTKDVCERLGGELLRLIEVGASCFNHYCVGYDVT